MLGNMSHCTSNPHLSEHGLPNARLVRYRISGQPRDGDRHRGGEEVGHNRL